MTISVIIPVYNAEKFLRKAVESALQFSEVQEVLLIEDGSPDNALGVCQQLVEEDKRVKLFQHPNGENRGAGASRNVGLQNATCNYIAFLDADDFYLPNRFDKDKEVFKENEDADGCYNAIGVHYYNEQQSAQFEHLLKNGLTTIQSNINPENLFEKQISYQKKEGHYSIVGLTIKKTSLSKLDHFFNEGLRLHQDTHFIWRLGYYLWLFPSNITEAVALRGVHEDNRISESAQKSRKQVENQLKLFASIILWSQKEKLPVKYQKHFNRLQKSLKLTLKNRALVYFQLLWFHFTDPAMITKKVYYNRLHEHVFGTGAFSKVLFKLKEKIQLTLKISDQLP